MRIRGISAVALVLFASLVAAGIGCGKTTPSIGMMDAMPLSTHSFGFVDYKAPRTDEDLKPMLDQIYVEELLERSGLDSTEQVDALSISYGQESFLVEGSFDLDSVEDALDENGYERDDNYKGIRCWRVGAGGYTALVSSSLIITGRESYVKSCVDVIMGDGKSLYDDEDFRDIAERLPNGIGVFISRETFFGPGAYEGFSIGGMSWVKKDSDTMQATALLKFDSVEDADNAEDYTEEDFKGDEEVQFRNVSVTRVGRYVRVTFEADIRPVGESEIERARAELHQAQTAIAACMAEAGRAALDSDVIAWDGSPGRVTCTVDSTVYDAAQFLQDTFKATYDVDIDGQIYNGTPVSWTGIAWDDVNLGWVEAE